MINEKTKLSEDKKNERIKRIANVPEDAIHGFLEVRESNVTNMHCGQTVWKHMSNNGHYEGCDWLIDYNRGRVDPEKYTDLIEAVKDMFKLMDTLV